VNDGVLEVRKGLGTFVVSKAGGDHRIDLSNMSFANKTLAAGRRPSIVILDFLQRNASMLHPFVQEKLKSDKEECIVISKRLRLADEKPAILECHYLRQKFVPLIRVDYVSGSIYDMYKKRFRINLTKMDETIMTIIIRGKVQELFRLGKEQSGFLVYSRLYSDSGNPLYFAEVIYRGDAYEYHNRMGPIQIFHQHENEAISF
jgi:DNA-binding GntR family transcriptional regulator